MLIIPFALLSAAASILYGVILIAGVLKQPQGDEKMRAIARAIQEGASAYLRRQNKVIFWVGLIIAIILYTTVGISRNERKRDQL